MLTRPQRGHVVATRATRSPTAPVSRSTAPVVALRLNVPRKSCRSAPRRQTPLLADKARSSRGRATQCEADQGETLPTRSRARTAKQMVLPGARLGDTLVVVRRVHPVGY